MIGIGTNGIHFNIDGGLDLAHTFVHLNGLFKIMHFGVLIIQLVRRGLQVYRFVLKYQVLIHIYVIWVLN